MKKRGIYESDEGNNFLGYKVTENGLLATTTKFGCDSDWHDLNIYVSKMGVRIQWVDNKACIISNGEIYNDHVKIRNVLQSLIVKKQLEKARSLSLQGVFFTLDNIDNKNSHTIFYNWKVTDELVKFVIKARMNILPTNFTLYIWDRNKDPKCVLCSHPTESMAHLLNSCTRFKNFRSRRHDRLVSKIHQFVKDNTEYDIYENKMAYTVFPGHNEDFRQLEHGKPDIICISNKKVIVIEVTVCYDVYMNFAYEEKINRYSPLIQLLREKGYNSKLLVMCFGSLGTIEKSIYSSLYMIKNDKVLVKDTLKWCSISTLIAANYIWRYRVKYTLGQ